VNLEDAKLDDMIAELQLRGLEAAILTRTPIPIDVTDEKYEGDDTVRFTSDLAEDCADAMRSCSWAPPALC
jgi:hypothetical protein